MPRHQGCAMSGSAAGLGLLVIMVLGTGCATSLVFYEESRLAPFSLRVDPKSPDIVSATVGFKEMITTLVPEKSKLEATSVLTDFEVKYGGAVDPKAGWRWLRAEVTHGVATGDAARVLAGNMVSSMDRSDALKRASAIRFLSSRTDDELEAAAKTLNFET